MVEGESSGAPKVIPTRGLTAGDCIQQAIFLGVGILAFLLVWSLSWPPRDAYMHVLTTSAVILWILAVDIALANRTSVRRVEIEPSGVTFSFLFHRERVAWSDLSASRSRPILGGWWVQRVIAGRDGQTRARAYYLTREQTAAILSYPSRPRWTISEPVARSLGVSPERAEDK
jgi:hypothetical protein